MKLVRLQWLGVEKFAFRPGQWVGVFCENFLGANNKPLRRAFSIASVPGEHFIELCIARGQQLSAHLQDLPAGAKVSVDGPFGAFWLRPAEKYLFIAGGTGIAPLRPMIHEALKGNKEVTLLYSMKTPSDFIYRTELEEFAKNPKFKLVRTITENHAFPAWQAERGRVQNLLKKYWKQGMHVYVCGPALMVDDVQKLLVSFGQAKEAVFVDKWE